MFHTSCFVHYDDDVLNIEGKMSQGEKRAAISEYLILVAFGCNFLCNKNISSKNLYNR